MARGRAVTPRPEIRERFRVVVARGIARAEREQAEQLARLRPTREDRRVRSRERIAELRQPRRGLRRS